MAKHKRAIIDKHVFKKKRVRNIPRRRKKQQDYFNSDSISKNLEINAPANISLSFRFNNSAEYKPNLIFFQDSPYLESVNQLYSDWADNNRWQSRPAQERKRYLISVVANLLTLPRTSGSQIRRPLSINIDSNQRTSQLTDVIHFLRDEKYINFLPGFNCHNGKSKTSKIYPTEIFDSAFPPFADPCQANPHITIPDSELIRKNRDRKPVELTETDIKNTKRIRKKLQRINQVNHSHHIVIKKNKSELPCCTKLCVVYSPTLKRGGRLYASRNNHSYQNCSKEERACIFIDNEPTVEPDYSAFHPHMLYAEKGIQYEGKPYDLSEELPEFRDDYKETEKEERKKMQRKLSKRAVFIAINAKNDNLISTLSKYVLKNNISLCIYSKKNYRKGLYGRVIEAVKKKHSLISESFNTDAGAQLQNKDGKMALYICDYFAKKDIPILPVHDSFIVAKKHESLLRKIMEATYKKYNHGFTCPITTE
ncbi:MAG: hypothetical protein ACL93V_08485 [Candidatus Electrothrix sp. YB6]